MGHNYLIEKKTLWEKKKLLVTSNFFFSHNIFKNCLLLMRQNEYLWSKGLKFEWDTCYETYMISLDKVVNDKFHFEFISHVIFVTVFKSNPSYIQVKVWGPSWLRGTKCTGFFRKCPRT